MKNIESLTVYKFNHRVIHANLEGITHEESLISSEKGGSSINWIVGHILVTRDDINEIVGLPRVCDDNMINLYKRGSNPLTADNALKLEKLLDMLDESQKKLVGNIEEMDLTDREKMKNLAFYAFHEAYHSGQTGLLRRITGKEGAIK